MAGEAAAMINVGGCREGRGWVARDEVYGAGRG